jgi:very-short-patch-repair endonuclease
VTKGSNKKVWWLCDKGHEWQAQVNSRTERRKTNCPFCFGRKVGKENNLKFLCPEIAKEWHPAKNGNLKPNEVRKSSHKKVWWLCSKGHEWITSIQHRTNGSNCPKCSSQSSRPEFRILSELETIFKQVDSRYKFKKTEIDIFIKDINVGIEYDGSYFHKNKINKDKNKNTLLEENSISLIRVRHKPLPKLNKFDVIVELDELTKKDLDNIFNSIYNFCNNKQKNLIENYLTYKTFVNEESYKKYLSYFPAPIPSKSLASLNIKFINEWNYKKNYPLTPESFSTKSSQKVWWLCHKGHEWESRIFSRTILETNCPFCCGIKVSKENNLKFLYPEIAKEWHPTKNGNFKPEDVTKSSNKKVWWLCDKGHEWQAAVFNRTKERRKKNCPFCWKKNKFLLKEKLTF